MDKIKATDITYRTGVESDIPAIVELLRSSLGEHLLPKSEAFWNWKHVSNPFGKSPVLVAEHGTRIIGVRAFMQWRWQGGQTTFRALRAVDTAVHPECQGLGIFTKLTMGLIERCKNEGFDLVFNTPNDKSRPGYLKMGWSTVGKLKIRVRFLLSWRNNQQLDVFQPVPNAIDRYFDSGDDVRQTGTVSTPIDRSYLQWRYAEVPGQQYFGWTNEDASLLILFRVKPHRRFNEYRLVELLTRQSKQDISVSIRKFLNAARQGGSAVITCTAHSNPDIESALGKRFFLPAIGIGPVVTIRKISDTFDVNSFLGTWRPSMGDMELF